MAERRQSLTSSGQPHSAPAAVADAAPAAGNGHAPRMHGLPGAERASLAGGEFRRVTSDGVVQVQEAGGAQGRSDEIERRGPGLRGLTPLHAAEEGVRVRLLLKDPAWSAREC